MPEGKFFTLISRLGGSALAPENNNAGSRLLTAGRNDGDDRQFWYLDPASGTLRNKASGLCINAGGDGAVSLQPIQQGNAGQQFTLEGTVVKNRKDGRVLDIIGGNPNVGVQLCAWAPHGGANQQFDATFQGPRYFLLKSEHSGRVIDIAEGNRGAGARICIWDAHKSDNQQWYEDRNGIIRSKLNDFVFDGSGGDIHMQPYEPNNPNRQWAVSGAAVVQASNPGNCLDVKGGSGDNGTAICSYQNKGQPNQKWSLVYV